MLMLLPDSLLEWVVNFVLILGIVGVVASFFFSYVARFLPMLAAYQTAFRIISVIVLVLGVYFKGGYSVEMEWRERVAELEAKVAKAEAESKTTNEKIKTKVITKTQVIRVRGEEQIKYIDREIIKYDEKFAKGGQCEIPAEFIKSHNDAAEQPK